MKTSIDLLDYLKANSDTRYVSVPIPEWGDRIVVVRSLTSKEKDSYEASCMRNIRIKGKRDTEFDAKQARLKLLLLAICKEEGNPDAMFVAKDIEFLASKNSAAIERLFDVAASLSRITDTDLRDLVGNSELGQTVDSGSN